MVPDPARDPQFPRPPTELDGLEPLCTDVRVRLADPTRLTTDEFFAVLPQLGWFSNCGKPSLKDGAVERVYDWRDCPVGNEAGRQRMKGVHSEWARESGRVIRGSGPFEWWNAERPEAVRAIEFSDGLGFEFPDTGGADNKRRSAQEIAREMLGITLAEIAVRVERRKGLSQTLAGIWDWYRSGHWPCSFFQPVKYGVSRLLVY